MFAYLFKKHNRNLSAKTNIIQYLLWQKFAAIQQYIVIYSKSKKGSELLSKQLQPDNLYRRFMSWYEFYEWLCVCDNLC